MAYPYLRRQARAGDLDSEDQYLLCGSGYDLELLRPNLASNGSFESGVDCWTIDADGGTIVPAVGGIAGGVAYLSVVTTAGNDWVVSTASSYRRPVTPARLYTLRFWTLGTASPGFRSYVRVDWYDEDNAFLESDVAVLIETFGTDWTLTTVTGLVPPSGAGLVGVRFSASVSEVAQGGIDGVEIFPQTDTRLWSGSAWVQDSPTFATLAAGDYETLTFDSQPFAPSPSAVSDPVSRYDVGNDTIEIVRARPRRTLTLTFPRLWRGFGQALDRFHRMTRGTRLYYVDRYGVSHDVSWSGEGSYGQLPTMSMIDTTLTFVEYLER